MDNSVGFEGGAFVVKFEFAPKLVAEARAIPYAERRGDVYRVPMMQALDVEAFAKRHNLEVSSSALRIIRDMAGPVHRETRAPQATPQQVVRLRADGAFGVRFPWDIDLVNFVKTIPGTRWLKKDKEWKLSESASVALHINRLVEAGFVVQPDAASKLEEMVALSDELYELSAATDSEFEQPEMGGLLWKHQCAGLHYGVTQKRVLIADKMGLGKTVEALAILAHEGALPAVILGPSVAKYTWLKHIRKWLPNLTVQVLEGRAQAPRYDADIIVLNYDILGVTVETDGKKKSYVPTPGGHLEALLKIGIKGIVADESHFLKHWKSQRTRGVAMLAKNVPVRLLLTGTPVENRPIEAVSQLRILGRLEEFGGWKRFVTRYCDAYEGRFGWDLKGSSNLPEFYDLLRRTCYVRRLTEQVLPDLPALKRIHVPVPISNRAEYDAASADVKAFYRSLLANHEDMSMAEVISASSAVDRAEHLVRLTMLKKLSARGKMDAAREWIENFLESTDEKLLVFAHHIENVKALAAEFSDGLAIYGDVPAKKRSEIEERYQTDPSLRVLVLQTVAGGVNLTLTEATAVLFLELEWTPSKHDQAEYRTHGRLVQDKSVRSYYLLGENTIDEDNMALLEAKQEVVDAVTDGREIEVDVNVAIGLVESLLEQVA